MFKTRLKELMKRRGVSQTELARCTGLSKSGISQYLSGVYEPSRKTLARLADALEVSPEWLSGEDEKEVKPSGTPATISVARAAELLGIQPQALRMDLQSGKVPFGFAYRADGAQKYTYRIYVKPFMQYTGIAV